MVRVRVRQHVNPLSKKYQQPLNIPDWEQVYQNCHQPLLLDIGCARGQFIEEMAQLNPHRNFLGLEIRETLVEYASYRRDELGFNNLHYLFSNANNSLTDLLESLPMGILQQVTIQFPDPWFKKRHNKRRVVQPELVNNLCTYLTKGGTVFLQSDVEELAKKAKVMFQNNPHLQIQHQETWLGQNPFPIATERETITLAKGEPVYRALFAKI